MNKFNMKGKPISGEYRAKVENVEDPEQLLRVQVRIPGLWDAVPPEDLPWAEYKFSSARKLEGGIREGDFSPAQLGDWVWIDFPNNDTRYPRITGWCHFAPEGLPNMTDEAWAFKKDAIIHEVKEGMPEPEEAIYHGSQVFRRHGIVIEINPFGEWLLTQKETGTAIRVTKEGDLSIYTSKDRWEIIDGEEKVVVGKNSKKTVEKDVYLKHGGDLHHDGPKQDYGESSSLEPSVLGDKLATWITAELKLWLDNHTHIGNLGAQTSPAMQGALGPFIEGTGMKGGAVYSKKNRNQ